MNNEELMMNNEKYKCNKKGITLIALIITIIIMLILAGVVLTLTLGDHGIFKTAQEAVKNYVNAEENELSMLNAFDNLVNNNINIRNK